MKRVLAIAGALSLLAAPANAADGWNWNSQNDRLMIDKMLRKIGEQCGQLGFTPLTPPEPATMEKRIYSKLLLQSASSAEATVERWSFWLVTFMNLEEGVKDASDRAGQAVLAASVDPTSREQARQTFVDAFMVPFAPVLDSCREAAADEFVGANYLSGAGSLDDMKAKTSTAFDQAVANFDKHPE